VSKNKRVDGSMNPSSFRKRIEMMQKTLDFIAECTRDHPEEPTRIDSDALNVANALVKNIRDRQKGRHPDQLDNPGEQPADSTA